MVSIVDELETRGFLERRANPTDRRVHELHLTRAGGRLLEQASQQAIAYEQQVTAPLTAGERERLLKLLERISAHLGIGPGAHTSLRGGVDGETPAVD
jgi:DNA-binding MarR family transcriptional regulator